MQIVDDFEEILLNKRLDVISHCRQENKYKLKNLLSNKKGRTPYNNRSS